MVCVDRESENLFSPLFYPAGAAIKVASSLTSQGKLSFYGTYLNLLSKFIIYAIASLFIFTKVRILSYSGGFFLLCSHFVSLSRPQCEVSVIPSVQLVWVSVSATPFSSNVTRTSSKMRVSQAKSYFPSILQVLDLPLQVIELVFCHRFVIGVF